ncbi:hypothetical protein HPB52_004676 [Rhipicephalus sanguineus]|uniref:Uncharacterized protein n=1 Tax=Rhipicephalus sanguineus TaxID=34632 RepID=A0A9D4SXK6_RHISA|nr:hypothetical protein HPB52_004676 [Rhipicephalus sanguineus]
MFSSVDQPFRSFPMVAGPWNCHMLPKMNCEIRMNTNVVHVYENNENMFAEKSVDFPYASLRKFVSVLDFIALMITDGLLKPSRYRRLSWESIRLQRHLDSKPNELQHFSPSHFSLVPLGPPETDLSLMMSNVSIEQNAEEWDRWDSPSWFAIAFCLLGVVPGLFTSAVLTIYFFSTESAFETTLEEAQASGSSGASGGDMAVPTIGKTVRLPPSLTIDGQTTVLDTTTRQAVATSPSSMSPTTLLPPPTAPPVPVSTTSHQGTVSPSPGANSSVCMTEQCHFLAQWLLQKLDPKADPCEDFYSYTDDLVEWMISIDLDLGNVTALETVDPKDMMVRCSLDFGVHAIITIFLHDVFFANKKRAIVVSKI